MAAAAAAAAKSKAADTITDVAEYLRVHNPGSLRDLDVMCSSARRTTAPRLKHALFKLHGTSPSPRATDMDWPQSTSLPCWNCFQPFTGVPLAVPLHRDSQTGVFTMDAVLCSPACGLRYIVDTAGSTAGTQTMLFREAMRNVFGIQGPYAMAPERRWLRAFCGADMPGALSIDEYRGNGDVVVASMRTLRPPFVPATVLLEMTTTATGGSSSSSSSSSSTALVSTPVPKKTVVSAAAGGAAAAAILASGGHAIRGLRRPAADAPSSPPQKTCSAAAVSMAGGEVDPTKPLYLDYVATREQRKGEQLPLAPPPPGDDDDDDVVMADDPPPPLPAAKKMLLRVEPKKHAAAVKPATTTSGFGSLSQFIASNKNK